MAFVWGNVEGWPVRFVTENAESLFGWTAADFLSGAVAYDRIIHPDDIERVGAEVAAAEADPQVVSFEHEPYRVIDETVRCGGSRT